MKSLNKYNMEYTFEEGLAIAAEWNMEYEYILCINAGDTPRQALEEWDLI